MDIAHSGVGTSETGAAMPGLSPPLPEGEASTIDPPPSGRRGTRRVTVLAGAFALYLLASVGLWWNVWSSHPTSVTTCGCGDTSLFLWFLEWPAYALAHGHNLLYSTALFHPAGINLVANTSALAVGVPLAPVTWLFGPVATLNVASTLGPPLSALGMFWLLGRWVHWTPAAFVGGLVFGFSPFVFVNLAGAHLMTGVLVLVPLMVACLDQLLIRQERRPVPTGACLGLLLAVEFFVSSEVLSMVVLCLAASLVLLVGYAGLRHAGELAARTPHALRGLGTAGVVTLVLLAYPVWFALEGPAHLSGLVWPNLPPGLGGIDLGNLWHLRTMDALRTQMQATGGYEGPALPEAEYLGAGMIAVLIGGVIAWRRDRRLWFFGSLAVIGVVLSLGIHSYWTPWRILARVPLLQNIVPSRFAVVTSLGAAVMLAIVVDRTFATVRARVGGGAGVRPTPTASRRAVVVAGAVGLAVAAVATAPRAAGLASNVPLTVQSAAPPLWFTKVGPHLPPGQVVLAYPAPFALEQSAEGWQAIDSLDFALVGGSGPESIPQRAGVERAGQQVIADATFSLTGPPKPTKANVDAVRQALTHWGVTTIVVADPSSLPRYDRGTNPAAAVALFTVAVGRAPQFTDDAWVWSGVQSLDHPLSVSAGAFARCSSAPVWGSPRHQAVPECVITASRQGS
jgi:hypothetical protein